MITIGTNLITLPISSYVTEGLAKICGFEVLRHGTSFPQYFGILHKGGDPSLGGRTTIEYGFDESSRPCKNYFFVFKDSEAYYDNRRKQIPLVAHLIKRIYPRAHAALAGASFVKNTQNKVKCLTIKSFFGIFSFFCPAVRFLYRKSEMNIYASEKEFATAHTSSEGRNSHYPRFVDDKDYENMAYKTPDILPNDRIGLPALWRHARWADIKHTATSTPSQTLIGTAQLVVGLYLTVRGYGLIL